MLNKLECLNANNHTINVLIQFLFFEIERSVRRRIIFNVT